MSEFLDTSGLGSSGHILGDYRIVREIGRGGMGVVYEAEQISLKRRVALKVLPFGASMEPKHLTRFRIEAQAAASLKHPGIVPVYTIETDQGIHFYTMQYIEGRTLSEVVRILQVRSGVTDQLAMVAPRLAAQSALTIGEVTQAEHGSTGEATSIESASAVGGSESSESSAAPLKDGGLWSETSCKSRSYLRIIAELGVQAAEALHHAHESGIVHRDIKPSNLILSNNGNLWVTDFGLALMKDNPGVTQPGEVLGTLRYMSPEQASGNHRLIDHRSDVYSLGATLYELLTLRPVARGNDRGAILRAIHN
jgi:serine/threonine protein kinase